MALAFNDTVGTATLTNGSAAVVGQGTSWLTTVNIGDQIVGNDNRIATIASVNSNTSLTLTRPWQGTSQAAQPYEIRFLSDVVRMQETTRALLNKLTNGNFDAFADLALGANQLPYATGAGTMAMTPLTAAARSLLDDASISAMLNTLGIPLEDGSWTPTLQGATTPGTWTPTSAAGLYRRLGKLVYLSIYLVGTLSGSAGRLQIAGLPFSQTGGTSGRGIMNTSFYAGFGNFPSSTTNFGGLLAGNVIDLYRSGAVSVSQADVSGTITLYGNAVYPIA